MTPITAEAQRLDDARTQSVHWRRWGPYLSDRQWGTVREDYSPDGTAWDYFPHDQARSRAYRWGEDGIAGISDNHQRLCFAIALWNGVDPILKERFFGLTGNQGNHGEDVKEYYFYLDSTPTHSYMKMLYKYPQAEFPYARLEEENQRRGRHQPEFELLDTGVFEQNRYFDVLVEYAKATADDLLIQISISNRGDRLQTLRLLPTLWFRNTWSWDHSEKPVLKAVQSSSASTIEASHPQLGQVQLSCNQTPGGQAVPLLFTENETNYQRIFAAQNHSPYVKDGIDQYIVHGQTDAVNPAQVGTKAAADYSLTLAAGETQVIQLRLCPTPDNGSTASNPLFGEAFEAILQQRQREADEFYHHLMPACLGSDRGTIQRQALAGMLWNKQYFYYVVDEWLKGDPASPPPPPGRKRGRNREWRHLHNEDILSMCDKWEYPWFAAWDLAFHTIPLAMIDPDFAKQQLDVMTREWYMHPNGQIPAYEWAFSDVNPPVHAWATWRVYKIEQKMYGRKDRQFLERVFQKLLLNFTWWVNRKDRNGRNIFEGGFLGMDNVGVFDRSAELPTGGFLEQSDGTSWMGMYCLNLLTIALELAKENPVYEDIATKFFEHFLYIADAMNKIGDSETSLWDGEDGFYYDVLHLPTGEQVRLKVRSMVGLIPLFAVETLEPETLEQLPGFKKRVEWFMRNRPGLRDNVACMEKQGVGARRLLAIAYREKLRRILEKMLDETEFLSDYGIRSVSKYHATHPYRFYVNQQEYRVDYEPAESSTGLFGGNSNWRGPIWMPVNYLLIESLQKFHYYLGDGFKVECPTGSGKWMNLWEVAAELSQRLTRIFLKDESGRRPVYGNTTPFQTDAHWQDLILFYEYFHGDQGAGIGASHQTGWTGLVAKLIQQWGNYEGQAKAPDLHLEEDVASKPIAKG
ncbi:MAG: glucosidase [Leptolyngbyaceae cyanobacterium SL_7_1]|nr:glucosidase [Leptolyngbyaceae cyanobacterium SL_7_1]